jgi:C_GCAxxG_C_C family probable redox protein
MTTRAENASRYFANGFNCAQSVFVVFGPEYGLSTDQSLKVACAFGGGMGRQQQTCGAVTGALMALGMKYGKADNDPEEMKKLTYDKTFSFFNEFEKQFGSTNCRTLLNGLDMNNADDMQRISKGDLFKTLCPKYVSGAVNILEELM